jgi:hypothetical protein
VHEFKSIVREISNFTLGLSLVKISHMRIFLRNFLHIFWLLNSNFCSKCPNFTRMSTSEKFEKFHILNGQLASKIIVFLGLFYSFRKKKKLCRRIFFNSGPFSSRKFNLKTQFFYNNTTRSGWFSPKQPEKPLFLNF